MNTKSNKESEGKMTDYYELLEVKNTASIEVIRAAYKAGVKRYHPDNYTDEEDKNWATEQLKLLNEALDLLTDEDRRAEYDMELAQEKQFSSAGYQDTEDTEYDQNQGDFWDDENRNPGERENSKASSSGRRRNSKASSSGRRRNSKASSSSNNGNHEDLASQVEILILQCGDEDDYLNLHDIILKKHAPESEKIWMLGILDEFTKVKLQQELIDESKLEDYRSEVKSTKTGITVWVVIAFALSSKFWWVFCVIIFLCICAYSGSSEERDNLKRAESAAKRIALYRMRGFKI